MRTQIPPVPISFLMPVSNEADIIESVIEEWTRDVFAHLTAGYELVLDDCSTDGTHDILTRLASKNPNIRILRSRRDGFYRAAVRLYGSAAHPTVFFTDSDGQYVAEDFWKLTPFLAEFDIVHGEKAKRKDPPHRLIASYCFNLIAHTLFTLPCSDINSAFRLVKRSVLSGLLPKICHTPTLMNAEMIIRAQLEGFKVKGLPVRHRPRLHGNSQGLPLRTLARVCLTTYRGLFKLRKEYPK